MDGRGKYGLDHENVGIYKWNKGKNGNNQMANGSCYGLKQAGFLRHTHTHTETRGDVTKKYGMIQEKPIRKP